MSLNSKIGQAGAPAGRACFDSCQNSNSFLAATENWLNWLLFFLKLNENNWNRVIRQKNSFNATHLLLIAFFSVTLFYLTTIFINTKWLTHIHTAKNVYYDWQSTTGTSSPIEKSWISSVSQRGFSMSRYDNDLICF